jgi:hypothetical protein
MATKHHSRKVIAADAGDSTCFSDVRWSDGIAYFTFRRDGSQDTAPMDRDTFNEWMDSGSLGKWYNENLR